MEKRETDVDVLVIGAGPAGLTAGVYTRRRGLRTLILEARFPGGRAIEAPLIENFPGFPESIVGEELAQRMLNQFQRFGGQVRSNEEVVNLDLKGTTKLVTSKKGKYTAKAVIIAIGVQRRKLFIPGEKEFFGRGVSYCALCDGPIFRGETVAVIGDGDEAFEDALFLTRIAFRVYLVPNSAELGASDWLIKRLQEKENATILCGYGAEVIEGERLVNAIRLKNLLYGTTKSIPVKGIFVAAGTVPTTQIIRNAGVELDERDLIKVDRRQQTNLAGVLAAGDCTGGGMQIATAVGEGAMAGIWVLRESR